MNTNIKVDVITKLPWKLILEGGKSFTAKKEIACKKIP